MNAAAPAGARAEKTRQGILHAAERLFAENGFAATRLEDIAEQVGIRRASMVYHFKDKRELHAAVLTGVVDGLHESLRESARMELPPVERIEAAICAWVDYIAGRPATARILLRELANAGGKLSPHVQEALVPLYDFVQETFVDDEHVKRAVKVNGRTAHASHVASTIAGATLFYVAALPVIDTRSCFKPLEPEQVDVHRKDLLRIARQLLGYDGP